MMPNQPLDEARAALAKQRWPAVALTPAQTIKWDETRTSLLWSAPFFAHVFYAKCEVVFSEQCPSIAATDGRALVFKPSEFFRLTTKERVFVAVHEIAHVIWMHCELSYIWEKQGYVLSGTGKRLDFHSKLMNVAQDMVINALVQTAGIGTMPKSGCYDQSLSRDGTEAVVDVYAKLLEMTKSQGQGQGQGKPGPGGDGSSQSGQGQGFDEHLKPGSVSGQDPHQAATDRQTDNQSWANTLTQAAAAARAIGKMPGNIDRLINDIIEPPIDWREHIQGFFNRRIGNTGYNWRHPDKRLLVRADAIIAPGRSGHGCGTIVCAVDTSGSIGDPELSVLFGCMGGILEDLRPKRLVVMWCDARVHRVDELEDAGELYDLRRKGAPGGGGTAFEPVFNEVAQMGLMPDALVYLTDTYGSFPAHAPAYPVLWATIGGDRVPWGDVVKIPPEFAK